MKNVTPMTEQFQHFVEEIREDFWGDVYQKGQEALKKFFESDSERQRDRYLGWGWYQRSCELERDYRNGYYERDYVTRFGRLRIRIARTRGKAFLPRGLKQFQRRTDEVALLIREAFLRGISTRQVGQVLAVITGEVVSAQTVSKVTQSLDQLVKGFQQAGLKDEWKYLFLDGVSLRVRRPGGRKRVQLLVAYGVRADGSRQLLSFLRSQGESQSGWEGLLNDLQQRGLKGEQLALIVTDGCPGLAAAIETVYPRARHQRCWVHKMRNVLGAVRRRDQAEVKTAVQAIYQAESARHAQAAFQQFQRRWRPPYPTLVKRLEKSFEDAFALRVPVKTVSAGTLPRFEMKAKRWVKIGSQESSTR
jgi:transposase-like protein